MIFTNSAFYYGTEVTTINNEIGFDEGGGEILATMSTGKYSLTEYVTEIARVMNLAGALTYTVSVDRATRQITIAGSGSFDLLVSTTSSGNSAFASIGFSGSDRTSLNSYKGNLAVGSSYLPQFRLQNFVDFDDNQSAILSNVLTSADGSQVEVVKFGTLKIMECEIDYITDLNLGKEGYIRTDLTGVAKARAFLEWCVTKGKLEFIPDILNPSTFNKVILESTPESKDGVGFKLKEQYSKGLVGFYTTGVLEFRELE
jgi:hypothetical protein